MAITAPFAHLHLFTSIFDDAVQHFGWNLGYIALNTVFDLFERCWLFGVKLLFNIPPEKII